MKTGNYYGARYYDPRLSIFLSVDPLVEKTMTAYAYCNNNPINFVDPTGMMAEPDKIKGVSKVSAMRVQNEIHNSFQGDKFKDLRNLFQLDSDGLTMKSISQEACDKAITGLSKDEQSLAFAYFKTINSTETHLVDMTMSYETLNPKSIDVFGYPTGTKGIQVDRDGVGLNANLGDGSLTVFVMDSKTNIGDYIYKKNSNKYNRRSTPAEILSHELLGHGYGRSHNSSTWRHEDAIQMTNLYWRVTGYNNFYRDGSNHYNSNKLEKNNAQAIPIHFRR